MTKLRAPGSIDAALARIAGHLEAGYAAMATLTGRAERTVRNWGDPDTSEQIPVDCAIVLDLAFRAEGGDGAPLFECYAAQLDAAGMTHFADQIALGRHTQAVIKEGGDAHAALVRASQPGATDRDRAEAQREVQEAIEVLHRALPMLVGRAAFGDLVGSGIPP